MTLTGREAYMLKMNPLTGIAALLFLSIPATGPAAEPSAHRDIQPEIRLSVGRLNGKTGEFVYDAFGAASGIPGYKVSELQWQLNDVYMLGLGASVSATPRLRFNVDYWRNVSEGYGAMDDFDWLYVGLDWSHWSYHEDTAVTEVSSLDLNGEFTLFDFIDEKSNTAITGLLGYKQERLAWQAKGGFGIYSDLENNGFRDVLVSFPDVPVITYKQDFQMPYIGIGIRSEANTRSMPIVLSASFRYSNQVHGDSVDTHHLRDLRFEDSGDHGTWQAYDIGIDFHFRPSLAFNLTYAAQRYAEIKATTTVTDLTTGEKTFFPGDSAGLDHRSNMVSLGLTYKF
jgi:plasminogen activator